MIKEIIKTTRESLFETRIEFGKRFGVTDTAVYQWEAGSREAPYRVIEFCLRHGNRYVVCPECLGKGVVLLHDCGTVGCKGCHTSEEIGTELSITKPL